jgi:hypothetical protein
MAPPALDLDTSDADAQLAREAAANAPKSDTAAVDAAVQKFPALAKVAKNVVVQDKFDAPGTYGQLESYPPWEGYNPNPGKFTVEVYNKNAKGQQRTDMIAGDMLHYLGAVDPSTNQPVDPEWRRLKEKFISTLRPEQIERDKGIFENERNKMGPGVTFEQWMDVSRSDAYLRGYLTPDPNGDKWRYPPEQVEILKEMKAYLEGTGPAGGETVPITEGLRDDEM